MADYSNADIAQKMMELENSGDRAGANTLRDELKRRSGSQILGAGPDDALSGSTTEDVLAGAGKRITDLYQGAKQLITPKSSPAYAGVQADIDAKQKLDAPLENSTAGKAGGMLTDLASFALPGGVLSKGAGLLPKTAGLFGRLAEGAGIGAAQSSVEPVATGESQLEKTLWGAGGGAAGAGLQAAGGRLITPLRETTPERTSLANLLQSHDIPVSAAQRTGAPLVQSVEQGLSTIPGVRGMMTAGGTAQKEAYTGAISKQLGIPAEGRLTEDVLANADKEIGKSFDAIGKRPNVTTGKMEDFPVKLDDQFGNDLTRVEQKIQQYEKNTGTAPGKAEFEAQAGRYVSGDNMTGADYNAARSALTKEAAKAARAGDSAKAEILRDLREVNDQFAMRTWSNAGAPELAVARQRYAVLKDLEKPGVIDSDGYVNPAQLNKIVQKSNPTAYAEGDLGEYGKLAKAGSVLQSKGSSGTARDLYMANLLMNPHTILGGLGVLGSSSGEGEPGKAAGGLAGVLTSLALTQTPVGRKYMANSVLNHGAPKYLADLLRYAGPTLGASAAMK